MNTQEALEKLERIDDLFGDISNNLVYVCEELPSLGVAKDVEERIVAFCCAFLERLVEEDKNMQGISAALKGNVDRVPHTHCGSPPRASLTIEASTGELWQNVQAMHNFATEFQSSAKRQPGLATLSVLLNEASANILKGFAQMREEFDALLDAWKGKSPRV